MPKYIDADALIAKLATETNMMTDDICEVLDTINAMPAADVEPVRKWNSCAERLPDHDGSYLVCTNKSKAFMAHFYTQHNKFSGKATIAYWMDRPSPPGWRRDD